MKKKKYISRIIFILVILAIIYAGYNNMINRKIAKSLYIHVPITLKLDYEDTHDWFFNDGKTVAESKLTDKQISNIIEKSESTWNKGLIPSNIKSEIEGRYDFPGFDSKHQIKEKGEVPNTISGYWIFKNRSNRTGGTGHYSIGVIDLDTNTFYYISYDG